MDGHGVDLNHQDMAGLGSPRRGSAWLARHGRERLGTAPLGEDLLTFNRKEQK